MSECQYRLVMLVLCIQLLVVIHQVAGKKVLKYCPIIGLIWFTSMHRDNDMYVRCML